MNAHVNTRCFPAPAARSTLAPRKNNLRILDWMETEGVDLQMYSSAEQNSLSVLIPLLLCGEQSAQLVFSQEVARLAHQCQHSMKALQEVELDEYYHDLALQHVLNQLPKQPLQRQAQRKAKRFYTSLARADNLSQHFVRISTLDACVTQLMQAVEHCYLGAHHPFARLCGLIKKDEAKHVYVSRQHAFLLGATKQDFVAEQQLILAALFGLLSEFEQTFTQLGIDLNLVFQRLEAKWQ